MRYQDMRDSHPVRTVSFDLDSGLKNLCRFIPLDSILDLQQNLIGFPSVERCETILEMLRTIRAGTGRRRAPGHLFTDELDSRCWEVLEQGRVDVPEFVGRLVDIGAGLFAAPQMPEFCMNVYMEAHLGLPNLKTLTSDGLPAVWVSAFVGELAFGADCGGVEPRDGYARALAVPQANGTWKSDIVYDENDGNSAVIRANHYLWYAPAIARAVLMRNGKGEFWTYISRDWEVPDGGNVMRISEGDASALIELGLHVYPMIHEDPRDAYVKWDKSDVWVTDPVPPMPDEGIELLKDLLTVMDASDMIADAESWITRVGQPLSYWGHLSKGNHHYRCGEYSLAIDAFDQVLEMHPDDYQALYGRGGAFVRLEKPRPAIQDFNDAIRIKPEHFESYIKRAEAHAVLRDFASGIDDCSKAIEIAPNDAIGYVSRWQIRWMMLMTLDHARRGSNILETALETYEPLQQIIDDIDNAVRLGQNYEELFINNPDVAGSFSVQHGAETAAKLLQPLMGGDSGPQTAAEYYYHGVCAMYTNRRHQARRYFSKAQELGFEDEIKIKQHAGNLESANPRRTSVQDSLSGESDSLS